MYAKFSGVGVRPSDVPNAEENKRFWGGLWSIKKGYNREVEWLEDFINELENDKHLQKIVVISFEKISNNARRCITGKLQGRMAFKVIGLTTSVIFMNGLLLRRT